MPQEHTRAKERQRVQGPFDARLVKGDRISRNEQFFGIYDKHGTPLPDCDIVSGGLTTKHEKVPQLPERIEVIERPTLFCGLVLEQFGHVLLNSLGRLWALDQLPPDTLLVFTPKRRQHAGDYPHLPAVLSMLGIENDFLVRSQAMRFTNLWTASDLFGERHGGRGTLEFYYWVDRQLLPAPAMENGRKLYVSRSSLGLKMGRYANEIWLEGMLAQQGYEVFHPEKYSLQDQIDAFRRAEKLIFAEGSALHLFAMVRREGQSAAMIKRRRELPPLIKAQMDDRTSAPMLIIDAIKKVYWPPQVSDHLSVSLIDWASVSSELASNGFLPNSTHWQGPNKEEEIHSLEGGLETGQKMLNSAERNAFLKEIRRKKRAKRANATVSSSAGGTTQK